MTTAKPPPHDHHEAMGRQWDVEASAPVLFLHGVGLSAGAWRPWYPVFIADFAILAPDLRGHGQARTAWNEDPRLDDFVDDVEAVLRAHGYGACHIVGESFGGTVGIAFARRHAEMVRSLTLVSTPYDGRRIATLEEWPALVQSGEWPRWMAERRLGEAVDGRLFDWLTGQHAAALPAAVLGVARLLRELDLRTTLNALECPALVISPSHSAFLKTDAAKAMHAALGKSGTPEIAYIAGGPHGIFLTHAEACARLTRSFIGRRG